MAYKTTTNKEFKEKGFYNPEDGTIISTKKDTNGIPYDVKEALQRLGGNGDEIEITIKKSESIDTVEEE